jgi:hypothetical protein
MENIQAITAKDRARQRRERRARIAEKIRKEVEDADEARFNAEIPPIKVDDDEARRLEDERVRRYRAASARIDQLRNEITELKPAVLEYNNAKKNLKADRRRETLRNLQPKVEAVEKKYKEIYELLGFRVDTRQQLTARQQKIEGEKIWERREAMIADRILEAFKRDDEQHPEDWKEDDIPDQPASVQDRMEDVQDRMEDVQAQYINASEVGFPDMYDTSPSKYFQFYEDHIKFEDLIVPELIGPVYTSALFSMLPWWVGTGILDERYHGFQSWNVDAEGNRRDGLDKYLITPISSLIQHSLFASPDFTRAKISRFATPGAINLFIDVSFHQGWYRNGTQDANQRLDPGVDPIGKREESLFSYSKTFRSLREAHNHLWPMVVTKLSQVRSIDKDNNVLILQWCGFTISQSYQYLDEYSGALNSAIKLRPDYETERNFSYFDYLVAIVVSLNQSTIWRALKENTTYEQALNNENLDNVKYRNANFRIYRYIRCVGSDIDRRPKGFGQTIRYFTWLQRPFVFRDKRYVSNRQMIFRDAHASTPSPRSADKDRNFFAICEKDHRRKCILGTAPHYNNAQHVNISLPNENGKRVQYPRVVDLNFYKSNPLDVKKWTSTRYPKNCIGILAGCCEAFNPDNADAQFMSYPFFYEPFNYEKRDPRFNGVQPTKDLYYGYGLDEYLLTRLVHLLSENPEIKDEVDVYFWMITWCTAFFNSDTKDDNILAYRREYNRVISALGLPMTYSEFIEKCDPEIVSSYNFFETLYGSTNTYGRYSIPFVNNGVPPIDKYASPGLQNAEYHIGRFDRVDIYNVNTQYLERFPFSRNVGTMETVYQAMACMMSVPVDKRITNIPLGNGSVSQSVWVDTLPKCVGKRGGASRARRLPSLPTRRGQRSSSSSKRRYTHRQRALRTGKGGYRPTKSGRKA